METNNFFKVELLPNPRNKEEAFFSNVVIGNVISVAGFPSSYDENGEIMLEVPMYQGRDLLEFCGLEWEESLKTKANTVLSLGKLPDSDNTTQRISDFSLDVKNLTVNLRPKRKFPSSEFVVAQVDVIIDDKIMLRNLEIEETCKGLSIFYPVSIGKTMAIEMISVIDEEYRQYFESFILNAYRNGAGFFSKLRKDFPRDTLQTSNKYISGNSSQLMGKEGYL